MSTPTPFVDVFGLAVAATEKVVLPRLKSYDRGITCINYDYGSNETITSRLNALNKPQVNQKLKYPAVIVGYGFKETVTSDTEANTAQVKVIIAWPGKVEQPEKDRQAAYRGVLRIIEAELFGRQIRRFFLGRPKYTRMERRWINNGANTTSDILDIIELDVTLKRHPVYCNDSTNKPFKNF